MAWFRRTRDTAGADDDDLSTGTVTVRPRTDTAPAVPGEPGVAPVDEPAGEPAAGAVGEPVAPDPAVLDELSDVFADESRPVISIGGADDLPDAVYLDEAGVGEGEGEDGTLFIDDDGSSDPLPATDATAGTMEPRIRQRRIGVNRAASRRRLRWVALVGLVLVVAIGALAVLGSSWFAVDQVSVTGNVYTDAERLDAVVDDLRGTPVLLVDTDEAEAQLEEIPWVESARVTTRFPDAASIEIRERVPVASVRGTDGLFRVLDADGRVLDVIDGQPVALVWISGTEPLDLSPGTFVPIGYSSAASLVTKLTPTIRARVETIVVTPDGSDLVLVLGSESGPIEVRFGSAIGDNDQIEKLVRLERTLDDRGDEVVTVIDVSTSQVTVR